MTINIINLQIYCLDNNLVCKIDSKNFKDEFNNFFNPIHWLYPTASTSEQFFNQLKKIGDTSEVCIEVNGEISRLRVYLGRRCPSKRMN